MRVANPAKGLIRFADVAPNGFATGELYAMRFAVLRAGALASLRLTVDEMHTTTHTDASAALSPAKP
jgi:hypothetical protein